MHSEYRHLNRKEKRHALEHFEKALIEGTLRAATDHASKGATCLVVVGRGGVAGPRQRQPVEAARDHTTRLPEYNTHESRIAKGPKPAGYTACNINAKINTQIFMPLFKIHLHVQVISFHVLVS